MSTLRQRLSAASSLVSAAVLASAFVVGCGDGDAASAATTSDVLDVGVVVSALSSLPTCTSTLSGTVAFVSSTPPAVSVCNGSAWSAKTCSQSNAGQVLFASTTQSVLAVCAHSLWSQVVGPQGPTGATGAKGATGSTGATGTAARRPLVKVQAEPKGVNCTNGGQRIDAGSDTNGDGTLQSSEILQTSYACDGTNEAPSAPINNLPPIAVSAGNMHACAVVSDGTVWCWGDTTDGKLGKLPSAISCNGASPCAADPHPLQVPGVGGTGVLSGAIAVAAGGNFSCALLSNGNVVCWGNNFSGQLGQNNNTAVSVPVLVKGVGGSGTLSGVVQLVAGPAHACARLASGAIDCWGDNTFGQVGSGVVAGGATCPTGDRSACFSVPTPVVLYGGGALSGTLLVAAGSTGSQSCAIRGDHSLVCWGYDNNYELGVVPAGAGGPEPCAVGQCSSAARPVLELSANVVSVGVGSGHTCACYTDRTLSCWGQNLNGVSGLDPTYDDNQHPASVAPNIGGVVAVAAGDGATYPLVAGQTVLGFGADVAGALGAGHDVPGFTIASVANLRGVTTISAGLQYACALADRGVYCWGSNSLGQLGRGFVGGSSNTPQPVQ